MKTIKFFTIAAAAGLTFLFSSCSETMKTENSAIIDNVEKSTQTAESVTDSCTFTGTLTEAEIAGLMEMREEEKLARDVYLKFYEIHKSIPFKNISKSENAHMSAVLYLINGYELTDPALEGEGKFSNQAFADLYNKLVEQGSGSLIEAYKVAAFIEEYDIADLLRLLDETQNADVKRVYTNLLRGSEIHLRVYSAALARLNVTYEPTIISAELYQDILNKRTSSSTDSYTTGNYSFSDGLTDEEKSGLLEMREEEKLAQDVYLFFYDKYNYRVFQNIAKAEAAHTKSVLWLINGYGLEDPAVEGLGNFTNQDFTDLYKQLTEQGSASLEDALKVGAFIEEYDINDLMNLIEDTESDNIARVYGNLLKGSKAHIKAFTNILKAKGIIYSPTILSEEVYNDILGN